MRQSYETDYRPNYEQWLAANWIGCGTASAALMHYSGFRPLTTAVMTSIFFAMGAYQATFARRRYQRMQILERQEQNFFTMDELQGQMKDEALFLGRGFEWTGKHAQAVADLYRDPERLGQIKRQRKGATFLHGVGLANEGPVYMYDGESKGHVHVVGTTGAGKTRLFDLLITQCILRGEAVIIIDPKGDHEMKNNAEAAYRRLGRGRDFVFFHPAFIDESAAINPLSSRQRSTELASRLAGIIPTKAGASDPFQSFSQNALNGIFYGVEMAGVNPTIMDVQRALSEGFGPLCVNALEGWAYAVGPEMARDMRAAMSEGKNADQRAMRGAHFYQEKSAKDQSLTVSEMNNLIALLLHDPSHFKKMVASLVPVIGKLCAGPLATLFSPDPAAGRMPKSGKVISLEQILNQRGGCYIGLDTLSDRDVGRAMGQMIMADLASLAGKRYNFGREKGVFLNIFIDEASEVTNEQLIQLLNKGRGAGFRLFVATQTLADYEASTGSAAVATQILSNMNSTIMLRTLEPDTQERLSKRLPEVPISYVMKTTATSLGDTTISGAFSLNHGERLMTEDKPIVAPQSFGDLSDLEYFAVLAKGNLIKGRLPILDPPNEGYQAPSSEHYSIGTEGQSYDHDQIAGHDTTRMLTAPPIVQFEANTITPPVPPHRRRLTPIMRWVENLPGYRKTDKVHEKLPAEFMAELSMIDDEADLRHADA